MVLYIESKGKENEGMEEMNWFVEKNKGNESKRKRGRNERDVWFNEIKKIRVKKTGVIFG